MKPAFTFVLLATALLAGCAFKPTTLEHRLNPAGTAGSSPEAQAAACLDSAAEAAAILRSHGPDKAARETYNKSVRDLTVLLREAEDGRLWNRPLVLKGRAGNYRLHFAKGTRVGDWDPDQFTRFTPAAEVPTRFPASRNTRAGIGGSLVGIRHTNPLPPFSPPEGIAAPVTALVEFSGHEATLRLVDPVKVDELHVGGRTFPLDRDSTAPLDWYRQESEWWNGLMGAIHVSKYMSNTGLYMLQPYDPQRIPLIFVHGLISTPQMWREVINGIESDLSLRGKYQYWVFRYPTGNPPGYSALRLREELKKVGDLYPDSQGYVLVGHSMGGIVSQMQAVTVTRKSWDVIGREKAAAFFSIVKSGSVGDRATTYKANPKVSRIIFICTPHRGSRLAIGSLGQFCRRLIALPADVSGPLLGSAGNAIAIVSGAPYRLPNSVTGLSPDSPALKVVDSVPLRVHHHSIIGDRGKGDTPNSSDGVVEYWSSRMPNADSELIVPGPHGSQSLPETIAELRRILHLHLKHNHPLHRSPVRSRVVSTALTPSTSPDPPSPP